MDSKHWKRAFSSHIFAHSPISFWVECGRMVTISMCYATVLYIHLVVLERGEREWEMGEWYKVVIYIALNRLNDWTDCSVREWVGVDFAEFTLGLVGNGVGYGNRVGWRDGMCGSVNHFQWESVGDEAETGSRMQFILNAGTNGNK